MEDVRGKIGDLQAALAASEAGRPAAEAMVTHLRLIIAKMRHDRYGASSERGKQLLDQLELELEDLETGMAEDDPTNGPGTAIPVTDLGPQRHAGRRPLPSDLPRARCHSRPNAVSLLWLGKTDETG